MDEVLGTLSHIIRRNIIRMIGNQGAVSYTDLTDLGLEPGTLYFHLDTLTKSKDPLVSRTGDKLYSLTELGQAAHAIMQQSEDQIEVVVKTGGKHRKAGDWALEILTMNPILKRIQADPFRFFFEIVIFLGIYGYLASEVSLLPVFLFFLQGPFDMGITILAAISAWITTYILVEALSIPILKKRGFSRELLASVPIAFIPHFLIELMWYYIPSSNILSGWVLTFFLTIIISWSTLILTIALSNAKRVRRSRAVIVTLIVTNLNILLLAVISVALV